MRQKNFWKKLKKPILALAPMAGFTDSAFRTICKEFGADVVYSEMASASALFYGPIKSSRSGVAKSEFNGVNPSKTLELLKFSKKERPYVVQLFGNNPEHFALAAKLITKKVKPDGIDINFGCPAPKVFKQGSGCALMRDKKLSREILSAVLKNTSLPVSIKIRAGIHPVKSPQDGDAKGVFNRVKDSTAIGFIKNIKDLPFSAVMVHGRTYEEGFSGAVDFNIIEKIKKIIPDKIVLANGGINSPEDAKNVLEKYPSIDGLGIARGALGRPHIFAEIKSLLSCHPERIRRVAEKSKDLIRSLDPLRHSFSEASKLEMTREHNLSVIKKLILKHAKLVWQEKKSAGIIELRKHLGWYVKGFPGASEMRQKLVRVKNLAEIKAILKS